MRDTSQSTTTIARAAGFETRSRFERAFTRLCRLPPRSYRALRSADRFEISLPSWLLREALLLGYWKRDPNSVSERVDGSTLSWAVRLPGGPALLHIDLGVEVARCRLEGPIAPDDAFAAHDIALRVLGLHLDPRPFEQRVLESPWRRLITGRQGWTPPQTPNLFDGLVWVVCGQLVSLPAAFSIRRRINIAFGQPLGDGWYAPPSAAAIAGVEPEELARQGLTRRKAEYLSALARWRQAEPANDGAELGWDLDAWRWLPAPEVERRLLAFRGLGPWSVGYLMMRALGFADCVPLGDVALLRQLRRFFDLEQRPDAKQTLELMRPFAPYRSLATLHFWTLPETT